MSRIQSLIRKSEHSSFYRHLLNLAAAFAIPFNRPHNFNIVEIRPGFAKIKLPYYRINLNHVKGIHACGLATLSEFTAGLAMLGRISEKDYRIILKKLTIEYHYQAKCHVYASQEISESFVREKILQPLRDSDSVLVEISTKITDVEGNHISTAVTEWQLKKWDKVRTK